MERKDAVKLLLGAVEAASDEGAIGADEGRDALRALGVTDEELGGKAGAESEEE